LQTTPDQAAQLRASLQTNPEDLAVRERLINYYSDEATAPPRFKRTPLHDAEFTEQILWIVRHHPGSRALALSRGLIDLMTAGQCHFKTPMLVEVRQHEPGDDRQQWDHEVDLDLDIPSGVLLLEGSGGSGIQRIKVPQGRYRARVSGRRFVALGFAGANGNDSYRLRLWPSEEDTEPVLRKSWPGSAGIDSGSEGALHLRTVSNRAR
jgi:hypothetical protein